MYVSSRHSPGGLDHASIEVDTHYAAVHTDTVRGQARDEAGTTSHVENVLGWSKRRDVDETTYPRFHDQPHIPLVEVRRGSAHLPKLFAAHDCLQSPHMPNAVHGSNQLRTATYLPAMSRRIHAGARTGHRYGHRALGASAARCDRRAPWAARGRPQRADRVQQRATPSRGPGRQTTDPSRWPDWPPPRLDPRAGLRRADTRAARSAAGTPRCSRAPARVPPRSRAAR